MVHFVFGKDLSGRMDLNTAATCNVLRCRYPRTSVLPKIHIFICRIPLRVSLKLIFFFRFMAKTVAKNYFKKFTIATTNSCYVSIDTPTTVTYSATSI